MSRLPIREWYRRANAEWPAQVPQMSAEEGIRAARRLYRFVTGRAFTGPVKIVSGRRNNDIRHGVMYVSPSGVRDQQEKRHAWDRLVHDLSHRLAPSAGVDASHGGEHARLERSMVKEVVARGWLDGALKSEAKPEPTREEKITEQRRERVARIDVLRAQWERKAKRAANALKKLNRQLKAAQRQLDAPIKPESEIKSRKPGLSIKQQAEKLAAEHGVTIEVEVIEKGNRHIWVMCSALEGDNDPHEGDHIVREWSEVLERVRDYVKAITGSAS